MPTMEMQVDQTAIVAAHHHILHIPHLHPQLMGHLHPHLQLNNLCTHTAPTLIIECNSSNL